MENRRGKDDEMSGGMWEAVETKAEKIRVTQVQGRRSKRRSRKEMRREGGEKEKETKKEKDNGSEESGRRMGDLG